MARQQRNKERRRCKPCLPPIIIRSVRSLANKMDDLKAVAQNQREYWECSLMCFIESGKHQDIPDDNASVNGFHTVWADRDSAASG